MRVGVLLTRGAMARDGLDGLSREELLELVRCQQVELAEREAVIERRDEKIRESDAPDGLQQA